MLLLLFTHRYCIIYRCSSHPHALYLLVYLLCLSVWSNYSLVCAVLVNITFDDSDPSISYQPLAQWHDSRNPTSCTFCLAPSNTSIPYDGTWHYGYHALP